MRDETNTSMNEKQYSLLRRCADNKNTTAWNAWRRAHPRSSIRLVGADLENARLEQADLKRADLRAANLQSAILTGANLREAKLNGAMFFRADLSNVDLQGALLYGADLSGVNLEGANLFKANLSKADLKGAKLAGLRLDSEASLKDLAHPLSDKQIASVIFLDKEPQNTPVTVIRKHRHREAPVDVQPNPAAIIRSIMFEPENIQAGIGILNYFGEILRQKYEDNKAKVIVEQQGLNVKLAIETGDGERKVIERALENYITVVTGRETIANFLPEPLAGLAFKQKLDLVRLELKQAAVLQTSYKAQGSEPLSTSADSEDKLYNLLSKNICISRE